MPPFGNQRRLWTYGFSALVISYYLIFSGILIYYRMLVVNYPPLDGVFQTYNPIRRILLGQLPGDGFQPYLGLGITYLTAFLTYPLGGDFSASLGAALLAQLMGYGIIAWVLSRIVTRKPEKFFMVFSFLLLAGLFFVGYRFIFYSVGQLSFISPRLLLIPDNSNMGLRLLLPFLMVALLLAIGGWRRNSLKLAALSVLTGGQIYWSNDFGFPSFAVLLLLGPHLVIPSHAKKHYIFYIIASIVSVIIWGFLLNSFNPSSWIDYNIFGVAKDQNWYFNSNSQEYYEISFVDNIIPISLLILTSVICIHILWVELRNRNKDIHILHLSYISCTCVVAIILTNLSQLSPRVFILLYIIFPFILIKYVTLLRIPIIYQVKADKYVDISIKIALTIAMIVTFYISGGWLLSMVRANEAVAAKQDYFDELGGYLTPEFDNLRTLAQEILQESVLLPPDRRLWSTYRTALDEMLGVDNPAGYDYIIHALGPQARQRYLDQFSTLAPLFIQTPRRQYSRWEDWSWRQNWWFYRRMLVDYRPYRANYYTLIWRRDAGDVGQPTKMQCTPIRRSDHRYDIEIKSDDVDAALAIADVTLHYHIIPATPLDGFANQLGFLSPVSIHVADHAIESYDEIWNAPVNAEPNTIYTIPTYDTSWSIPMTLRPPGKASVSMWISGITSSRLEISGCDAKILSTMDNELLTTLSNIENINNGSWKNGISLTGSPTLGVALGLRPRPLGFLDVRQANAGFILPRDDKNFGAVFSGTEVEFAHGGLRRVIDVIDNQVWVDGPPLDPVKDGYPHKVKLIFR